MSASNTTIAKVRHASLGISNIQLRQQWEIWTHSITHGNYRADYGLKLIERCKAFFFELDDLIDANPNADIDDLVCTAFPNEKLRDVRHALSSLIHEGYLNIEIPSRSAVSTEVQSREMLSEVPDAALPRLRHYRRKLLAQKAPHKTVTSYLRAAARYERYIYKQGLSHYDHSAAESFADAYPGYVNSLLGYINFLSSEVGIAFAKPCLRKPERKEPPVQEIKAAALEWKAIAHGEREATYVSTRTALVGLLALIHGLFPRYIAAISRTAVRIINERGYIRWRGEEVELDATTTLLLKLYLQAMPSYQQSKYLFPGQQAAQPISSTALCAYFHPLGFSCTDLEAAFKLSPPWRDTNSLQH